MSLDPLLLDVLACPVDKGPLLWFEDEDVLYNPRLQRSYAVVDGVPVLLVDEAVSVGDAEHERLMAKAETNERAGHGPGIWVSERASLDTLGMWEAAAALPEQLSGALRTAERRVRRGAASPGGGACRAVAAFGLGTGAMAASPRRPPSCAPDLAVPFWRGDGSAVPAFVDADTLVFAVSSSGGTAETLDAAAEAVDRGATVVAVGGEPGGALARLADDAGFPWCPVEAAGAGGASRAVPRAGRPGRGHRAPAGRAGPGRTAARLRGRGAGGVRRRWPDGATRSWRRAAPPAELARRLGRTIPLVYGSAGVGGRGRRVVEGPGEPQRQGAGLRGDPAGA